MSKKFRKVQGVNEPPSFVVDLTSIPADVSFPPRSATSDRYLGPIFFGKCNNNQPPLHSVDLNTFGNVREKNFVDAESISSLFYPKTEVEKPIKTSKLFKFKSGLKHEHTNPDLYSHKCLGTRKIFTPEFGPRAIDFGQSTSIIEGETVLEISFYRLKKASSRTSTTEFELVKLSNIKEKNRAFMPYNDRISHIHFPKEFATVTVNGPTIPAAITIKKIPSKRKTPSVTDLLVSQKVKKTTKGGAEISRERKADEIKEGGEVDVYAEEHLEGKKVSIFEESLETIEIDEESDHRKFYDEHSLEEIKEAGEVKEEDKSGVNVEEVMEEVKEKEKAGSKIRIEKSEEAEEQEEENTEKNE